MKKLNILLISVIFTLVTNRLSAQLDTLNYIKQFEVNKVNYIGLPLSKLLNDMTLIKPKTIWPYSGGRVKTKTIGSMFKFSDMDYSFHNAISLLIYWQDDIPRSQTEYYEQKNAFYFTNDERIFYGSKIIKDIQVFR